MKKDNQNKYKLDYARTASFYSKKIRKYCKKTAIRIDFKRFIFLNKQLI